MFLQRRLEILALTSACLFVLGACGDDDVAATDGGLRDANLVDTGPADARTDLGPTQCATPADCQDGVYCNGYEACDPGAAGADEHGCVAGTAPCAAECDETGRRCTAPRCDALPPLCTSDASCGNGSACDGVETCDAAGVCQPGTPITCDVATHCLEPSGTCGCLTNADCDDAAYCNGSETCVAGACTAGTNPCGARSCLEAFDECGCTTAAQCDDGLWCTGIEGCNATTNRCTTLPRTCPSGNICLEGGNRCAAVCTGPADCDNGIASDGVERCVTGACVGGPVDADGDGHDSIASGGDDCDDNDAGRYPGATEICDADDEDCDPTTLGFDFDGDGFMSIACCNGPGNCGTDCNDHVFGIKPGAIEVCNGTDDNCNGLIDEDVAPLLYRDRDGDGAGDPTCTALLCSSTVGWATSGTDCDDTRASILPGVTICAPDGTGTLTCTAGSWASAPCTGGTNCSPQPGGTGLCL
jgi:hypothetical protein